MVALLAIPDLLLEVLRLPDEFPPLEQPPAALVGRSLLRPADGQGEPHVVTLLLLSFIAGLDAQLGSEPANSLGSPGK